MLGKLSCILLWGVVLVGADLAQAADAVPSTAGVLVLRNGSVLTGQVVRTGDHYLITGEGVETRLRAGDVDFFCRDLTEAYARKRLVLQADDWEARFIRVPNPTRDRRAPARRIWNCWSAGCRRTRSPTLPMSSSPCCSTTVRPPAAMALARPPNSVCSAPAAAPAAG